MHWKRVVSYSKLIHTQKRATMNERSAENQLLQIIPFRTNCKFQHLKLNKCEFRSFFEAGAPPLPSIS